MSKPDFSAAELPTAVRDALHGGRIVELFKLMRAAGGISRKDLTGAMGEHQPGTSPPAKSAVDGFAETHPQLPVSDLSPGEVRASGWNWWWAVALAAACILGYWFLRH